MSVIESATWVHLAAAFGLLEFVLQLWVMRNCPFRPLGDEIEYMERGRSANPYRFPLFHRLPVLPTMARLAAGTGHPCATLRLTSVFFSAAAMAATAGASTRLGGPVIATVLCLFLLLVPERIILGSRIWPDVYLAAATGGIALILSLTPAPIGHGASALLTGLLVAFAVLVRLDALVLVPAAAAAWVGFNGWSHPIHLLFVVGPAVAAFLGWWWVSKALLGESWPDTTWKFNLGIAAQDALAQTGEGTIVIDDLIERHRARSASDLGDRAPEPRAPWTSYVRSIISRLRAMTGPDVFINGKLLPGDGHEQCIFSGSLATGLLRLSVPLFLAASIVVFAASPTTAGWLALPSIALLLPPILFHARTRYRLPVLFGLVPALAGPLNAHLSGPHSGLSWIVVAAAISVLTAVLAREPQRLERP